MEIKKTNPKISIVIIFFNAEKTITSCINSILLQTFSDYEIICINDGSTDNTLSKINSIPNHDKKIKIFNQKNQGLGCARNSGINNSNGDYICFVDSDDTIKSGFLKHAYNKIDSLNSDLIIYDLNYNRNSDHKSTKSTFISDKSYIKEKVYCFYRSQSVCSAIIKKEIFTENNISFPTNRSFEDFFVLYKLISKSKKPIISKRLFYNYTSNTDSVSNNLKITDFINIFASIQDFYIYNKNIESSKEVLSERINNILKYVITKLSINESLSYKNSIFLVDRIFLFTSLYNLKISSFYYNLYLLVNNNPKLLEYIKSNINNDTMINQFAFIIQRNEHIMQNLINFLVNNNIKYVSILGIGNPLSETVELILRNNIKITSIFTDLEVHSNFKNIETLDLYSSSKISSPVVVIASYVSSNKFTNLALSKGNENIMALNFHNILNAS